MGLRSRRLKDPPVGSVAISQAQEDPVRWLLPEPCPAEALFPPAFIQGGSPFPLPQSWITRKATEASKLSEGKLKENMKKGEKCLMYF